MPIRSHILLLLLVLALAGATAGCELLYGPSAGESAGELEQQIFRLVNEHRRDLGLPEVVWNETIAEVGREHSHDMAEGKIGIGHDGYADRFARLSDLVPWRAIAEVVGYSGSARDVVDAWLASPNHKGYLEGDYDLSGVGVVKPESGPGFYVTEIFIKPM